MPEQVLCALLVENGTAVDLRRHLEADAGREVGLDGSRDDVDRGTLRRHDEVDAGRTRLLREPLHGSLDLLARGDHEIGELVDNDHDVGHRLEVHLLALEERLARARVDAGLDPARQRLAALLGAFDAGC